MATLITRKTGKRKGLRLIQFVDGERKVRTINIGRLPKHDAKTILDKVESLASASISKTSWDRATAEWVGDLSTVLYERLAKVGLVPRRAPANETALEAWLKLYFAERQDVKGSTKIAWGQTRRCLLAYFGAGRPLSSITPGDTDNWRIWLAKHEKLADNTIRRRCGIARQFFRAAFRAKLITENPFAGLRNIGVKANRSRDYFISRDEAQRVLDACPDAEWRLLFALSRYGGLRCPSEHLALRWDDVDWERDRMIVRAPKTEHHQGKESRVIPIFPELRPYLEDALEVAERGAEFVIMRYRDNNANLRTQLNRIIGKAKLDPWPKLFQNLRSTRETELIRVHPVHVVCEWLGNTPEVALRHYLQVTDDDFEQAQRNAQLIGAAQVNPGVMGRGAIADFPRPNTPGHIQSYLPVGATGLEPVTSAL
jgi:integrase